VLSANDDRATTGYTQEEMRAASTRRTGRRFVAAHCHGKEGMIWVSTRGAFDRARHLHGRRGREVLKKNGTW